MREKEKKEKVRNWGTQREKDTGKGRDSGKRKPKIEDTLIKWSCNRGSLVGVIHLLYYIIIYIYYYIILYWLAFPIKASLLRCACHTVNMEHKNFIRISSRVAGCQCMCEHVCACTHMCVSVWHTGVVGPVAVSVPIARLGACLCFSYLPHLWQPQNQKLTQSTPGDQATTKRHPRGADWERDGGDGGEEEKGDRAS